jgi:hypothetical protein
MSIDITIIFVIRFLLAFIFLRAALHKVNHYRQFSAQINSYRLLPGGLLTIVTLALTLIEGSLALTLLVTSWPYPSVIAAGILGLYASAMGINLLRGRLDLDCGCSGPSGFSQTISWPLVIRNCVLATLALFTALPITSHNLSVQDISTVSLASIAAVFIYASIEQAIVNRQRRSQYFALKGNGNAGALE